MSKLALSAGQIAYWRNRLGQNASSGQILRARAQKMPAAKPSTPAQPAQPAGGPALPDSPVFDQTVANVNRDLGVSDAEYDYQTGRIKQEYGIGDNTDPFSRQAILNQQYANQQRDIGQAYTDRSNATFTGLSAQGQLHSSAMDNAQGRASSDRNRALGDAQYGYDASSAQLGQQYQDLLHNLGQQKATAHATGQDTASLAAAQSLQDAVNTPPDPNAVPPPKSKGGKPKPNTKVGKTSSWSRANLLRLAQTLNLR